MGKMLIRSVIGVLGLMVLPFTGQSQVSVETGVSPEVIVNEHLIGEGIKVRKIKFTGDVRALGVFENPGGQPGFDKGILLSTGLATDAAGPNNNPKTSTVLGKGGSKDLYELAKGRTFDASVLEFEFIAARDSVTLHFMFASEEYNDYVGSTFSDAFMIRISGPGFPNGRDLGMIPGTNTPINVNTVNYNTNGRYYNDNNPFTLAGRLNEKRKAQLNPTVLENMQYDGMTKEMSVGTKVKPRETYRIQIAIADAGDGNMDSGLFIKAGSMQSIEQYRWVLRRQKIAEKRRLDSLARVAVIEDSLARVAFVEDSLAAIEREIQERIAAQESARQDSLNALRDAAEINREEQTEEEISREDSRRETQYDWEPGAGSEEEAVNESEEVEIASEETAIEEEAYDYHQPPGPGDEDDFRAVIRFGRDDFLVPESSEGLVIDIAKFMLENPELNVGIYVPGRGENSTLRYDMIRVELLKGGLRPNRIFKNGFSFLSTEDAGGIHRAEIWVRRAE